MSDPFLTEIRMFSFTFAPKGWALCNGQLLPINQNQAIFALLGTTYGGDGRVNFGLPNLQGRVAMAPGPGTVLGQQLGQDAHTISLPEMPAHTHVPQADAKAGDNSGSAPASGTRPANTGATRVYSPGGSRMQSVPMNAGMVTTVGGSQAHENRQPFLCVNFCIALVGIFPSRN